MNLPTQNPLKHGERRNKYALDFTGAIFDMDGTLLDSMGLWSEIGVVYLQKQGLEAEPKLREKLRALSLPQAAAYLAQTYELGKDADTVTAEIRALLASYYREQLQLKPGVERFLHGLGARGVKMYVATATDRALVEAALGRLGVLELFAGIVTCPEVGQAKDRPDVFLKALAALGTPLEQTVVFEDALHAVETAHAAGFRVIAVADADAAAGAEKIQALAERYLESFEEWSLER